MSAKFELAQFVDLFFQLAALMNFIDGPNAYCLYPKLTLHEEVTVVAERALVIGQS